MQPSVVALRIEIHIVNDIAVYTVKRAGASLHTHHAARVCHGVSTRREDAEFRRRPKSQRVVKSEIPLDRDAFVPGFLYPFYPHFQPRASDALAEMIRVNRHGCQHDDFGIRSVAVSASLG